VIATQDCSPNSIARDGFGDGCESDRIVIVTVGTDQRGRLTGVPRQWTGEEACDRRDRTGLPTFGLRLCIRKGGSLDLINSRDRKTFPLASTDESSEGLTSGVGRCDVGRIRYGLKQANAKNLNLSCTHGPKPTDEGTSIDRMDKVS